MNSDLTTSTTPMSYDSETRTFKVLTDDFNLIGEREFAISAYLTDYPSMRTTVKAERARLTIVNPCLEPDLVQAPA